MMLSKDDIYSITYNRFFVISNKLSSLKKYLNNQTISQFLDEDKPIVKYIDGSTAKNKPRWARFTPEEYLDLGKRFKEAHELTNAKLPVSPGKWDPEAPLWKTCSQLLEYSSTFPQFITYCLENQVVGKCTSRYNIEDCYCPPVKRGDSGKLVHKSAIEILPQKWKDKIKNIPYVYEIVIFHEHLYFIEPTHLCGIKRDLNLSLF